MSVFAPLAAAPKLVLAALAVVAPVPPPATTMTGRSAAAMVRKDGLPLEPFGAAKKVFAVCEENATCELEIEMFEQARLSVAADHVRVCPALQEVKALDPVIVERKSAIEIKLGAQEEPLYLRT